MQLMKSKPIKNPFSELDKIFNVKSEPQGKEWFTPREYSVHTGMGYSWATDMLRGQVKAKVLECWTGVSKSSHRRITKYRLIENKRKLKKG